VERLQTVIFKNLLYHRAERERHRNLIMKSSIENLLYFQIQMNVLY